PPTDRAGSVLHSLHPAPPASTQEREAFQRTAEGILRIVLDRRVVVLQAEEPLHFRRREGKPLLVATHQELLDAAEPLGEAADELIGSDPSALIPADVAGPHLQRILTRSEEHTSELQSRFDLVCRLLLDKKNTNIYPH